MNEILYRKTTKDDMEILMKLRLEMHQLPCPESKIIESTANIAKTIHTIQSEPVAKSANFIYILLLKFHFLNFINWNLRVSTSGAQAGRNQPWELAHNRLIFGLDV